MTFRQGLLYCNDGDWVENCSALTERENGELSLVYWTELKSRLSLVATTEQAA